MKKRYPTKIEMIKDLSEMADVDYEKTLFARHNSFFTKDGRSFVAPVFPLMVKLLNEHANANLKEDECFSLPRGFILAFKEKEEIVADTQVSDDEEVVEQQPVEDKPEQNETDESVKTEEQEIKKPRGRQSKK